MSGNHHPEPINADRLAALYAIRDLHPGNQAQNQVHRLLVAMQTLGHVTTFEASRGLDIYDPRARKLQLMKSGREVLMHWRRVETESGKAHRIGVYSLARRST